MPRADKKSQKKDPSIPIAASPNLWVYQVGDDEYAIVVVQGDGMSKADVKKLAMQRAAEQTVDQGFRYFAVVKEEEVQILQPGSNDSPDAQNPPPNLYNQLILRKDTQGDSVLRPNSDDANQPSSGYRLIVKMSQDKLPNGYDACQYTDCK
jgi:hypothetical protein